MEPKVISFPIAKRLYEKGFTDRTDYCWAENLRGEKKLLTCFGEKDFNARCDEMLLFYKYPAFNVGELLFYTWHEYMINPCIKDSDLIARLNFFMGFYNKNELHALARYRDIIARYLIIALHKKLLIKK